MKPMKICFVQISSNGTEVKQCKSRIYASLNVYCDRFLAGEILQKNVLLNDSKVLMPTSSNILLKRKQIISKILLFSKQFINLQVIVF
jgi:hypothetical protein